MKKHELSSRIIKTEDINWRELQFIQQDNLKEWEAEAKESLKASLIANNFAKPFYVWEDEQSGVIYCLDGKHRVKIVEELVADGHAVPYMLPATFIRCNSKKEAAKLVLIYSSLYAKVTNKGLFDFIKEYEFQMNEFAGEINLPEFSMEKFEQKFGFSDTLNELEKQQAKASLQEKFIVPPFSILDTRQGYWQERKQMWLKLGIKSEESRENAKVQGSFAGSVPNYYHYKEDAEKKTGKTLSHKDFSENYLPEYISNSNLAYTDTGALLSIFDPVLCEIMYRWFCRENGMIFDPFAGGSVRGIVAGSLGYSYKGIDLRKEQVEANEVQKSEIVPNADIEWITGNSLNTSDIFKDLQFDFVFSCPPYFDLEKYSDKKEDLSNMNWDEFKEQYREIIKQSVDLLKDNSFACFVVSEVRNKKTGFYRKLVNETIEAFENAGAYFYNEIILVNVAGSLPIRTETMFKSRKIGRCHQNVLVFYKGDPKEIKNLYPKIDFSENENNIE